jgi:hypothetical protein
VRAEIGCAKENQRTSDGDDQGDECRTDQWTTPVASLLDLGGVIVNRPRQLGTGIGGWWQLGSLGAGLLGRC